MCRLNISLQNGPETIINCIRRFADYVVSIPIQGEVIEGIVTLLYGSKKTRNGNAPTEEEHDAMVNLVKPYVKRGLPIESLTPWGAAKGYSLYQDRIGVDIGDVLAIRRFAIINEQIKGIYSPGMMFNIFQEDITEAVLSSVKENVCSNFKEYRDGLIGLCKAFNIPYVLHSESSLLSRQGKQVDDFLRQGLNNSQLFESYWKASSKVHRTLWEDLPQYKALIDVGWNGVIEQETRLYFLNRVIVERPNSNESEQINQVCTYLGIALARYQLQLLKIGDHKLIKTVFNGHPPGTHSSQFIGRIQYKLKDSKTSNVSIPPWIGYGLIEYDHDAYKPTVVSVRSMQGVKTHKAIARLEDQDFRCDLIAT